jgi:predicted metalloendopeptidase
LKHIDQTVSPCDDFYKFACGKWLENTVVPEDNNMISSFSVTQDMIDHRLKREALSLLKFMSSIISIFKINKKLCFIN